jgi:hypothetical protein
MYKWHERVFNGLLIAYLGLVMSRHYDDIPILIFGVIIGGVFSFNEYKKQLAKM